MKVFKFYSEEYFYAYAAKTEAEAKERLFDDCGEMEIEATEEIPKSEWDKKFINSWEDNNQDNEPDQLSINDIICGDEAQMVFTNDLSLF